MNRMADGPLDGTPDPPPGSSVKAASVWAPKPMVRCLPAIERSAGVVLAGALSFFSAVVVLRLWNANWRVPFAYEGDARAMSMFVRDLLDDPNYLYNPRLGWPNTQHMADIPGGADNLNLFFVWLAGLFTDSYGVAMNVFYVSTFVLVGISAYAALRLLGTSLAAALVGSTLFSLLPYHFARGEQHLFLSGYYLIPFAVLVIVWQLSPTTCLLRTTAAAQDGRRRRLVITLTSCVLLSMTGAYYAVFFVLLVSLTAVVAAVATRSVRVVVSAFMCAGLTTVSLVLNVLPTLLFWAKNGRGTGFARSLGESEIYGLKISNLFFPVPGHRISSLANLSAKSQQVPIPSEIGQQLGLLPALGLFGLLVFGLTRMVNAHRINRAGTTGSLALTSYVAILLGAVGGLSTLLSILGFSSVRVYSRLSVVFGFIGLVAVALAIDALHRSRWARGLPVAAGLALVAIPLGVFDQTTDRDIPGYSFYQGAFASDEAFVATAERILPKQGKVFQLPIVPFPESHAPGRMHDYDHLLGFLHSRNLRFSYGAVKGRDDWQLGLIGLPTPSLVRVIASVKYDAIWVDRFGYTDDGASLESGLRGVLGPPVLESENRRLALYRVPPPVPQSRLLPASLARTPFVLTMGGFVGPTRVEENVTRVALGPAATITVDNRANLTRPATLTFGLESVSATGGKIAIRVGGENLTVPIEPRSRLCTLSFAAKPGRTLVRFDYSGPPGNVSPDPGFPSYAATPYFRLVNPVAWDSDIAEASRTRPPQPVVC